MQFTSEQRHGDGVLEREFTLGEIPGVLWTPGSAPAPLILLGHPGGLRKMHPRMVARARGHGSWAEHAEMIDAIEAGDPDRAQAMARRHTERTREAYHRPRSAG